MKQNKTLLLILGVVLALAVAAGLWFGVKALTSSNETTAEPASTKASADTAAPADSGETAAPANSGETADSGSTGNTESTASAAPEDPAITAVRAKSVYTEDDLTADDPRMDLAAAECGSFTLTNRQAQLYYCLQYFDLLSQYGSYASMLGLDTTKPLKDQASTVSDLTWEQYFLMAGVEEFQQFAAAATDARAKFYEIPADEQAQLESILSGLEEEAHSYGFETADAYLQDSFGPCVTVEDYREYLNTYFLAMSYENNKYLSIVPTEEDLQEYRTTHAEDFADLPDQPNVNVRHILFLTDADGDKTVTEEERAAAQEKAEAMLATFLENPTEENFAALANANSEDGGSNTNGGLYEDVYPGQMVEPFENWCFDAARQPGDTGIVETSYGFHVMYYSSASQNYYWKQTAEYYIRMDIMNDWIMGLMEEYPLTTHYENVVLAPVPLDETE